MNDQILKDHRKAPVAASTVTMIGIGNQFRRDDRAGLEIVRQLQQKNYPGVTCVEESGEGLALMDMLMVGGSFYLFDAVCSGKMHPGTIYQLDAVEQEIPAQFFHYSTHHFSIAEAISLLRNMGKLPQHLQLIGIEGKNFDHGTDLSAEVEHAVKTVVQLVSNDLPGG